MICPYIVNISILLGGILSWGLMWPLIENRKGDWFSAELKPTNMHSLQGYKVSFHWKKVEYCPFGIEFRTHKKHFVQRPNLTSTYACFCYKYKLGVISKANINPKLDLYMNPYKLHYELFFVSTRNLRLKTFVCRSSLPLP